MHLWFHNNAYNFKCKVKLKITISIANFLFTDIKNNMINSVSYKNFKINQKPLPKINSKTNLLQSQNQVSNQVTFGNSSLATIPQRIKIQDCYLPPSFSFHDLKKLAQNKLLTTFIKEKKFSLDIFNQLSLREKALLHRATPTDALTAARATTPVALAFKTFLNQKYGEGNYNFVALGRSPVPIARVLEFSSVPVKYLPISCLQGDVIKEIISFFNPKSYLKYMDSIGLSFDKLEASHKKTILYDYTCRGNSLRIMEQFFKQIAAIPKKITEFRSLNKDLMSPEFLEILENQYNPKNKTNIEHFINFYLGESFAEKYSHIPKLPYYKVDEIFQKLSKQENIKSKFYTFQVLNILKCFHIPIQKST